MLSNLDIEAKYIELYSCLRQYIWDIDAIAELVDLEDSVCIRFPNVKEASSRLDKLIRRCKEMKDEELKSALLSFKDELDVDSNEVFAYLPINFVAN